MGTMRDKELARRLGVAPSTICNRRRALGIPRVPYRPMGAPLRSWNPENNHLLGTVSDSELARRLGVHQSVVTQRRRALAIPSLHPQSSRLSSPLIALDAQKVRARREALNPSRLALCEGDKLLNDSLSKIERGIVRGVKPSRFEQICKVLRCKPEDIVAK